jgi:hypothetical protein
VLVGASLATAISNPFILVASAFVSHFVLDMIPHKDYEITPLKANFYKLIIDVGVSAALLFTVISTLPLEKQALFALGGFFGILPDGLWMLYRLFNWKFLERYVAMHNFWHWLLIAKDHKTHLALGLFTQIAVSAAALCVLGAYAL